MIKKIVVDRAWCAETGESLTIPALELLTCPACGEEPRVIAERQSFHRPGEEPEWVFSEEYQYYITCSAAEDGCRFSTRSFYSVELSADSWNRVYRRHVND